MKPGCGSVLGIVCAALLAAGCGRSAPPASVSTAPVSAAPTWPALRDGFIEAYFRAQPQFGVESGRHEFDGQADDVSAAGLAREVARLHAARDALAAVDPGLLTAPQRLERDGALRLVDADLFWREKARTPFRNPAWYLGEIDPDVYLSRRYAPLDVRMKAYIAFASRLPGIAADIRANLAGPLPRSFVERAVSGFGGYAEFFSHDVAPVFAAVHDPALQQQLAAVDAAAVQSMTGLKEYFIALRGSATQDFALGKDLFAAMLQDGERVSVPIEQIEAAGRVDLERNTLALRQECDRYLPQAGLAACVAKVEVRKPAAGTVAAAQADAARLREFVVTHQVVSIPTADEAEAAESPPYNRANSAYIQVPGPYDHGVAAVFYISPPDPEWTAAEQSAFVPSEARLLITVVHEVWPGHFLQFLHSNANPSRLAGLSVPVTFSEGWAHYCEEMMIEMGLADGHPEQHIAQLQDALKRDVRLLSAIGMHTAGMTQAQSERLFVDKAFVDPGTARQQAARGPWTPATCRTRSAS